MSIELLFVIAGIAGIAGIAFFARGARRKARRAALRSQPFPPDWDAILRRNMPLYSRLPEGLREELRGDTAVFLAEKHFEGCGGLEVTEEMRVTIAAHACVLLLARPKNYYPKLSSILVYPAAFEIPDTDIVASGESSRIGAVALAWDHTLHGARDPRDAHNVALHEFAHQLDQEDGVADGTPILRRSDYGVWGRILGTEFTQLRKKLDRGKKPLIRAYGATNEAEFFAVATEVFFEKADQMKRKHPELYDALRSYYNQDPAEY